MPPKSMRYETCIHPYWEPPLRWERRMMHKKHRGKVKQKLSQLRYNADSACYMTLSDRQKFAGSRWY